MLTTFHRDSRKPETLPPAVLNSIHATPVGMTAAEVKGFGRQRFHSEVYRGAEYKTDFIRKIKLEMVMEDKLVHDVVETILAITRTGKIGDGGNVKCVETSGLSPEPILSKFNLNSEVEWLKRVFF